jgi:RimJ/RimL family protein N-acetyltransferase
VSQLLVPPPTDRLRFRAYRLEDAQSVTEMFDDEQAKRWYPTKSDPDEARKWVEWNLSNYEEHGNGLWVVEDRATSAFLGDCGLTYQSVEGKSLMELGYHLQRQHRGSGFALESAQACAAFALSQIRIETLCSIVDPRNEASIRVAVAVHDSLRSFVNNDGRVLNLYWTDNSPDQTRSS